MYFKSVFFCILFSLDQGFSYIEEKNLTDNEPNCHIDDVDLALITKNAKLLKNSANNIHPLNEDKIIIKRDATDATTQPPQPTEQFITTEAPTAEDHNTTTPDNEEEQQTDLNPEGIVGQVAPSRRGHHQRGVPPSRRPRDPRPITLEQQRITTQQINDHLNRLNQISDARIRDIEIEAIRSNLRQLSHTTLIQTPQQRSRMRNVVEETRRRQNRPRTLHSRIVGAPFPSFNEHSDEKSGDSPAKEIFNGKKQRHFEIITQDPRLVDE